MEAFRARLKEVRAQRKQVNELFVELKAELEKIPTPFQRKLAAAQAAQADARAGKDAGEPARPAPQNESKSE